MGVRSVIVAFKSTDFKGTCLSLDMSREEIEKRAGLAILELRKQKHKNGHPFMINSSTLPSHQCWLEYPSGVIHLVELSKSRTDFDIVKVLSIKESYALRKLLNL